VSRISRLAVKKEPLIAQIAPLRSTILYNGRLGEVAEWSNAAVLKTARSGLGIIPTARDCICNMPTSAHIDFQLDGPASLSTPLAVFERLIEGGWTTIDHGGVTYLPVGDSGDYDWQTAPLALSDVHDLFIEKQNANEVIGIVLTA